MLTKCKSLFRGGRMLNLENKKEDFMEVVALKPDLKAIQANQDEGIFRGVALSDNGILRMI